MNIVDSSGWLEYFSNGPNAKNYSAPLKDVASLIVPAITIYEVFKVILRECGENEALQAVTAMQQGTVCDLTANSSIAAAKLSLQYKLPMADSIIFSTAQLYDATIWTQDIDFKGLPKVKYFPKKK